MKRLVIALFTITTLTVCFVQLHGVVPSWSSQVLKGGFSPAGPIAGISPRGASFINSMYAPPRMVNGVEMAEAFIDIKDESAISSLKSHGVIVNCVFDGFVTAMVPVNRLPMLTQIPGVLGYDLSQLVQLGTDSTLSVTHAGQVLRGTEFGLPQAYDGSGVIVGIIDNGFDYQHIAFRSAQDTTQRRIVRVYDPSNTTGHPAIIDSSVLPGSVFMDEQIDTLTSDDRYGGNPHGTHTAGIAAGMHVNGYGGMAPGADIVMCVAPSINYGISEVEIANCIKYIYSYADSVGKPCVISLSISTYHGPHDGNDRLSKAIAQSVGPGRIFVIAAGNTALNMYGSAGHVSGEVTMEKPLNVALELFQPGAEFDFTYYYKDLWFSTWFRSRNVKPAIQFHILDKETRQIVWKSQMFTSGNGYCNYDEIKDYYEPATDYDSVAYIFVNYLLNVSTMKQELKSYLHNLRCKSYKIVNGTIVSRYQIGFSIYPPSNVNSCYVDSWICTSRANFHLDTYPVYLENGVGDDGEPAYQAVNDFYAIPTTDCTIGTYAVNDSVISAGGYISRNNYYSLNNNGVITDTTLVVGSCYSVSSYQAQGYGPTGKALPTVTAPAVGVTSSVSRYSYFNSPSRFVPLVMRTDDGNLWGAMTGTSMAAPTVAGIIAQWLQVNPNLSPSGVKKVIEETAIKDSFTGNPHFGPNGKIDAMAGIRYLLGITEPEFMLGDVNGDGVFNISDVTTTIDYLLGNVQLDEQSLLAADMNHDSVVNITDVTMMIDILLGNEPLP